ncbi:MAG: Ig-like domain-containing protein, partial [Ferruginibacter sp.]
MISFKSNPLTASLRLPVFLFICLIPGLQACKKKEAILPVDPAYARYVQAYTSGVVSKASTIRIVLAENVQTTHKTGEILRDNLVSISPAVEGKATWTDARTIEFKPAKTLTPATLYTVTFKLGKIIQVPEKFREMRFTFQTITPAFTVRENGLRSDGTKEHMYLEGTVQTADVENSPEVEKLLSAQYEKGKYKITWQHTGSTKKHDFKIESINRTALECPLRLIWNGKALGIKNTGEKIIQVPALGVFKVLQMVAINNEQQYASIQFSDPIAVGQELIGLVSFSKQENPAYSINGSEVKLFGSEPLDGNYSIGVYPGIKNSWGQILEGNYAANIVFDNLMPGVNILGKGNILPHSGKLLLPFEAVNLSAVDVSIVKIYENNIPQ